MISNDMEVKWEEFRGKVRRWWNNRSDDQLIKINSRREEFIRILQKRYGYTKEKATSELNKYYSKARLD